MSDNPLQQQLPNSMGVDDYDRLLEKLTMLESKQEGMRLEKIELIKLNEKLASELEVFCFLM